MNSKLRLAHDLGKKWRSKDIQLQEQADFSVMLLSEQVLCGLTKAGFKVPSPIQLEAIPIGRFGKDLLLQAKSGTGKTLVFTVVSLEMLKPKLFRPQVLILAPTREIAFQICCVIRAVGSSFRKLACNNFIGGISIDEDKECASASQIVIGTPGRIKHLIRIGSLPTNSIRLFVFDEADQLLQGTFKMEIDEIFKSLPNDKQVIATSATYPANLKKIIFQYLKDPYIVCLNSTELSLLGIVHYTKLVNSSLMPMVEYNNKLLVLEEILTKLKFSQCVVFCNMVARVEVLCRDIKEWGFATSYISSAKEQSDRLKAIKHLKHFKCKVLVSSDVTSRGIDAENVDLIINFDLPICTEIYLHRVGRAGRYGSVGLAISILTEKTLIMWKKFEIDGNFKSYKMPDPIPKELIRNPCFGQYTIEDNKVPNSDETECKDLDGNKFEENILSENVHEINTNELQPIKIALNKNSTEVTSQQQICNSQIQNHIENVDMKYHDSETPNSENSIEVISQHHHSNSQNFQNKIENVNLKLHNSETLNSHVINTLLPVKENDIFDITDNIKSSKSMKIEKFANNIVIPCNISDADHCKSIETCLKSNIPEDYTSVKNNTLFSLLCDDDKSTSVTYNSVNEEQCKLNCKSEFSNISMKKNGFLENINEKNIDSVEDTSSNEVENMKNCELADVSASLLKINSKEIFYPTKHMSINDEDQELSYREKNFVYSDNQDHLKCIENYIYKYENTVEQESKSNTLQNFFQNSCFLDNVISYDMIKNFQSKKRDYFYLVFRKYQANACESDTTLENVKNGIKQTECNKESTMQLAINEHNCTTKNDVAKELPSVQSATISVFDSSDLKESSKDNSIDVDVENFKSTIKSASDLSKSNNLNNLDSSESSNDELEDYNKLKLHSTPNLENKPAFNTMSSSSEFDCSTESKSCFEQESDSISFSPSESSSTESDSDSEYSYEASNDKLESDSDSEYSYEASNDKLNFQMITKANKDKNKDNVCSFSNFHHKCKLNSMFQSKIPETVCKKQNIEYSKKERISHKHIQEPYMSTTQYNITNPHQPNFSQTSLGYFAPVKCICTPHVSNMRYQRQKSFPQTTKMRLPHQLKICCSSKLGKCVNYLKNSHNMHSGCVNHKIKNPTPFMNSKNNVSCCMLSNHHHTVYCSGNSQLSDVHVSSVTNPFDIFYSQWRYIQRCITHTFNFD